MEELSIEEKARRYDEAKYIMKEYLESGNAGVIAENTIKKAFPELAESEDERIRKVLIKFHKSTIDIDGIKGADILAWLEKQGEQALSWSEEDEYHKRQILRILKDNGCSQTLQERTEKWIEERLKSLRPQNKTYYWTENEIKFAISDYIRGAESYEKMVEKLRCLKPQSQWKPSKEQMTYIQDAISKYNEFSNEYTGLVKLYNDLKKLKEE